MAKILQLGHFLCVNDESPIEVKVPHVMCYILCYSTLIGHAILEPKKKLKKCLVSYFKNNGIIILTNYVDANHGLFVKNYQFCLNVFVQLQVLIYGCPKGHMMSLIGCEFIGRRLHTKTH
jgi:hypothetical protein